MTTLIYVCAEAVISRARFQAARLRRSSMIDGVSRLREAAWQVRFALALVAAAIAFDMATTYVAFSRGGIEANPILAPMFATALLPWAVKLAALPLIVLIAVPFDRSERRFLAGVVCVAAAGLALVGIHNLMV